MDEELFFAAQTEGQWDIVLKLLAEVKDSREKRVLAGVALLEAIRQRNSEMAIILINMGISKNVKDKFGATPLMLAIENREIKVIIKLIEEGANPNERNAFGQTSLGLAVLSGENETALLLINNMADINAQDAFGQTALMLAVHQKDVKIVSTLIDGGADIYIRDHYNETAFTLALKSMNMNIIRMLKKVIYMHYKVDMQATSGDFQKKQVEEKYSQFQTFRNEFSNQLYVEEIKEVTRAMEMFLI